MGVHPQKEQAHWENVRPTALRLHTLSHHTLGLAMKAFYHPITLRTVDRCFNVLYPMYVAKGLEHLANELGPIVRHNYTWEPIPAEHFNEVFYNNLGCGLP